MTCIRMSRERRSACLVVCPERMTSTMASARGDSTTASVTERWEVCRPRCDRTRARSSSNMSRIWWRPAVPPDSAEASPRATPQIRQSRGSRNRLLQVALPVRTLLSPLRGPIPRVLWMLGRLRSASISRTRRMPSWASTIAQLMLVVVFPSCGSALVIMITLGGAPRFDNSNDVRSAR